MDARIEPVPSTEAPAPPMSYDIRGAARETVAYQRGAGAGAADAALAVWEALTSTEGDAALSLARTLAATPAPVVAAVAPF